MRPFKCASFAPNRAREHQIPIAMSHGIHHRLFHCGVLRVAALLACLHLTVNAQENLYREVVSREFSIHVDSGKANGEVVSREFSISVENGLAENQVISRELVLSMADPAAPPAVDSVQVSVSPTGDSVSLDWSAYNPFQYRDIGGFRIYLSDVAPITDVTGLTPIASTDGETTSFTLDGLTEFTDHYITIVAFDSLGNSNPVGSYSAAYVLSPETISREFSLFVGLEAAPPDREVISRELDLAIVPSTPPPAIFEFDVSVSPAGDQATLDWSTYNQWLNAPVGRFDIYLSDTGAITDVTGLTPFAVAGGGSTSLSLLGLTAGTDHFFAIVPVDPLGNFISTVNYGAAYVLSPEVISRELSLFVGQEPATGYREVVSREFDIVVPDAAVPPPVTGLGSGFLVMTSGDAFGAVVLDFTSYNETLVGDIVGYDVYLAANFFDSVAGLTPFARLPAGSQLQTLAGLPGGSINHFAVVAVDALGGFDPVVRSFSAQASISGVGEVVNLAGQGTATTLGFSWDPPENASEFLQSYRVRFGSDPPVDLPLSQTTFDKTGLTPGTGYAFRIATIDIFGNESSGTFLNASTWLPNPANLRLTLQGGQVVAQWDAVQPAGLVSFYRVFDSAGNFTTTAGLSPLSTTLSTQVSVGTLATVQNRWFAVTAVNALGDSNPAVISIQANKQGQTISFPQPTTGPSPLPLVATASSGLPVSFSATPPVTARVVNGPGGPELEILRGGSVEITASQSGDATYWPADPVPRSLRVPPVIAAFTSNGVEITDGSILGGLDNVLRVVALDADGISSAEFFLKPTGGSEVSLGLDNIPGDGFSKVLVAESFPAGSYDLRVEVRTPGGVTAQRIHPVTIELQTPSAPVIVSPTNGDRFIDASVAISGTAQRGSSVTILRGGSVVAGPVTADSTGNFTIPVTLSPGINLLKARAENAAGPSPDSATLSVELRKILSLALVPNTLTEGTQSTLTVTRNHDQGALTVALRANVAGQLSFAPSITFADGQSSRTTVVTAIDDTVAEADSGVVLTASASGYTSGNLLATVIDNDRPGLTLTTNRSSIAEGSAVGELIATVTRQPVSATPFTVIIASSDTGSLLPPTQLVIPGFTASASVVIQTPDNLVTDGDRVVYMTARILDVSTGATIAESLETAVLVTDNDGPALSLKISRLAVREGLSAGATIGRNGPTTSPLAVQLAVDDASEASAPTNVTIPAGASSANFQIAALDDAVTDGNQPVILTASASGFSQAQVAFTVTDLDRPDLAAVNVIAPTGALTEQSAQYSYRIENQGTVGISGPIGVRVVLSRDALIDSGDISLNSYTFQGGLPPGGFFARTESFFAPRVSGAYRILVEVDPEGAVTETIELNNVASSPPFEISPEYSATVATNVDIAPSGTDVPLTGHAGKPGGAPATFKLVNIQVRVRDTLRTISALTDSAGNFSAVFRPLPGEGGIYTLGAAHPGVAVAAVQDTFTLLGFSAIPSELAIKARRDGAETIGTLQVTNLANVALGELSISGVGFPSGVNVTGTQSGGSGVGPLGVAIVEYRISATSGAPAANSGFLRIASPEGAALQIPMTVQALDNQSRLASDVGLLENGMIAGKQSFVNFTVRNDGGVATGPVRILTPPEFSWLTTSTGSPLPSIPAGGQASVTLQLNPLTSFPLGITTGSLQLVGDHNTLTIPFSFRSLSDGKGDLLVRCEDEYTYFAASTPPLANCSVKVCDAITGLEVASGLSAVDGLVSFPDLREGYYRIKATAERHGSFQRTIFVTQGKETSIAAFLQRQTVSYTWSVVPTEIRDRYRIVIETEFETNVPAPVVVVEPSFIDLEELTEEVTQIDFKITNHGLIEANDVSLTFDSTASWEVTALASKLGNLAAKSSLTIPVTIRKLNASARSEDCDVPSGRASHSYICGFNVVGGGSGIGFRDGNGPGCLIDPEGKRGDGEIGSPTGSSGGGFISCDRCVIEALIDCGFSFVPNPAFNCGYSAARTIMSCENGDEINCLIDVNQTALGCVCGILTTSLPIYGTACNAANCFIDILQCIAASESEPGARSSYGEIIETFESRGRAVLAMVDFEIALLGDEAWRSKLESEGMRDFIILYKQCISGVNQSTQQIDISEAAALINSTIGQANPSLVSALIARWNRTLDYWNTAVFEESDVPDGQNSDFLTMSSLSDASARIIAAFDQVRAEGYDDPVGAFGASLRELFSFLSSGGGVCARVKLRLEQEAVMTRDAFAASLTIDNSGDSPFEGVEVKIQIIDSNGFDATDRFGIEAPTISGAAGGTVASSSSGMWEWTLVPSQDAAPMEAVVYQVSGEFRYMDDGEMITVPMLPQTITVFPNPSLKLKYFHQRDVYSDDPFTDAIEPSIPFSLGVMIENTGAGVAKNLKIASGQPEIVENDKGLLIDFNIIATEVSGQSLSPSLTADFGNLAPGEIKVGRWLMTSTLQGLFLNYSAEFEHLDDLGSERLSLIESVQIFETTRAVRALGTKDDGLPDFLVNATFDALDLPDQIHLSDGTVEPVAVHTGATAGTPDETTLTISLSGTGLGAGWGYLRIPDPGNGGFRLVSCVRSDGLVIPLDVNVWSTDRTFIGLGQRPILENLLHLVDCDSTGSYTLTYAIVEPPDIIPPTSTVATLAGESGSFFQVQWSSADAARYDIFISRDGSSFEPWIQNTAATSALYRGQLGGNYRFYSIGIDAAGNREASKSAEEATTTVTLENVPPTLAAAGPLVIPEGTRLQYQMEADDPDGPNTGLRYSISTPHPGITIGSQSGVLSWRTGEEDGGTSVEVVVTVSDSDPVPLSATQTVSIQVIDTNSPPVLAAPGSYEIDVGETLSLTLVAEDPDKPAQLLRYRFSGSTPTGMTLDPVTGAINWTPGDEAEEQSYSILVEAYDDQTPAGVATRTLNVTVLKKPGLPPEFSTFPAIVWKTDGVSRFEVTAADPEGEPVTVSADLSALVGGWPSFSAVPDSGSGTLVWGTWGVTPGTYQIPLTAATSRQSTTAQLSVEVVAREPFSDYESWATAYGLTPVESLEEEASNPLGLPNILAYALGIDGRNGIAPGQPYPGPQPIIPGEGLKMVLPEFGAGRDDLKYVIERSRDGLRSWQTVATKSGHGPWAGDSELQAVATELEGSLGNVSVQTASSLAAPVFFRLQVSYSSNLYGAYNSWASGAPYDSDTNGDGISNFLAWSLGFASPSSITPTERSGFPRIIVESSKPSFRIDIPGGAKTEVRYLAEISDDLGFWTPFAVKRGAAPWSSTQPVTPISGISDAWKFSLPSRSRSFLRVSATAIPANVE